MSTTTASGRATTRDRTPAQWFCLLVGATLLLAGILGFFANGDFDTGDGIQGDDLIVFEVNGIHNLVHIASGIVLLAAANTAPTAKTVAIGFGVIYGLVTLIGLIDGEDVLGLLPVNGADNVLHLLISVVGIAAGLASDTFRHKPRIPGRDRTGGRDRDRTVGTDADTRASGGATSAGDPGTPPRT